MNTIGSHYNFNDCFLDEDICRKISGAIKRSKLFAHIDPMVLLKEKLGINDVDDNVYESMPPMKKLKIQNPRQLGSPLTSFNGHNTIKTNITLLPTPGTITKQNESMNAATDSKTVVTDHTSNSLKAKANVQEHKASLSELNVVPAHALARPEPKSVLPEPKVVQSESKVVLSEPKVVQSEQKVVLSEPKVIQSEPKVVLNEPKVVQSEPKVVLSEPKFQHVESKTTLSEPKESLQEHKVPISERNVSLTESKVTLSEAKVVLTEHKLSSSKPLVIEKNQREKSKSPISSSYGLLPSPDSLFDDVPLIYSNIETPSSVNKLAELSNIKVDKVETGTTLLSNKVIRNDKNREKLNKNLFNLATFLLPIPSQLFDKDAVINALISSSKSNFIELFKEAIKTSSQISCEDLSEIIGVIVKENALLTLPDLCVCLETVSQYSRVLSHSFIKFHVKMKIYQENILNCLMTMLDFKNNITVTSFIEACYCARDWNKMWSGVLTKDETYKFEDKYFESLMSIFQNLSINSIIINHDTMLLIISYIMRNYHSNYEVYMSDIWLYCALTTDVNSETDFKIPQQILDKVIDKLIVTKNPSFLFIMKLLSKNWILLHNNNFNIWLAQLIAEKSDVKQCLLTLKESLESIHENDRELRNSFLFLTIHVMSSLNKKSLVTSSKILYDTFIQNSITLLKTLLSTHANRFTCKWIIVECLISATEYQGALTILKDFEVLKDLEVGCIEYDRVKEMLPNLVCYLLSVPNMLAIIDLFEQMVSIFILNTKNDISYSKNCSEIFNLIVVKALEANDKEVIKKILLLLDHIFSADIEFNISKDCLRYLIVAAVRTNIPFNEMLDVIDLYFKFKIFESIQTAEDGFGSFVLVHSNITIEEISILISWTCRQVKIKLVDLAQNEGASVRENLMKVCSLKFMLRPSKVSDDFVQKLGSNLSFADFVAKFGEQLNSPKYLTHPIKYTTNKDTTHDVVTINCDSRIVYNAIYYSDI